MLNFIYEFFIHNGLFLKSTQEGKTDKKKTWRQILQTALDIKHANHIFLFFYLEFWIRLTFDKTKQSRWEMFIYYIYVWRLSNNFSNCEFPIVIIVLLLKLCDHIKITTIHRAKISRNDSASGSTVAGAPYVKNWAHWMYISIAHPMKFSKIKCSTDFVYPHKKVKEEHITN